MGTGYETGAYMSYNTNGATTVYNYRGRDREDSCAAISGYPAYSSGCLRVFTINADGTPASTYSQTSPFDPRSRVWYTGARSNGYPLWSSLYTAAKGPVLAQAFSSPLYTEGTSDLIGVTVVGVNRQACMITRV
jgi:hypothetical protein